MSDRWERILDQKPVALREHLLDEAAKLLLVELRQWPLPVEEIDEQTGAGLAELFAPDAPRPSPAVLAAALKLARWDLDRERPVLLFVSRWVLEQLLSLSDATDGQVDRPDLLELVDRLERGLRTSRRTAEP